MANSNTLLSLNGRPVVVSLDADAALEDTVDASGNASKRGLVLTGEVNSQAFALLVRIQEAPNGFFLDILADVDVAALDTRAGAMDLSSRNHPSPTEDAIDTALLTAAS